MLVELRDGGGVLAGLVLSALVFSVCDRTRLSRLVVENTGCGCVAAR
jgi:hypothetical protein